MSVQNNSDFYDAYYFEHGLGIPYRRNEHWLRFFGGIADRIVADINPKLVMDAGCAMGFLVEALRQRGVDAYGIDISEHAIANVYPDVQPYCRVGSVIEPFERKYDLIICIEVLEHLSKQDAERAIENFCAYAEDILFSSTPYDYKETTHFNVQPPEYWVEQFARHGFYRDADFDASFVTAWAVRFRRSNEPLHRILRQQERRYSQMIKENYDLRLLAAEMRNDLDRLEQQSRSVEDLQQRVDEQEQQIDEKDQLIQALSGKVRDLELRWGHLQTTPGWAALQQLQSIRAKLAPPESARSAALDSAFRGLHQWRVEGFGSFAREGYRKLARRQKHFAGALPGASDASAPGTRAGLNAYQVWIAENTPNAAELDRQRKASKTLLQRPLLSFITPVYNPPPQILRDTIESALAQTYDNWELCLVDGNSTTAGVRELLAEYAQKDSRIRVKLLDQNLGISGNSNEAIAMAQGEFLAILDHDDLLAPDLLYEVVQQINATEQATEQADKQTDIIYFDEDKVSADGRLRSDPFFKPDWSPEMLLSANYLMHSVLRRSLVQAAGGFDPAMDGCQDWDLAFRCSERTQQIRHIPKVLYHWRQVGGSTSAVRTAKTWIFDAQLRCVENHLRRIGIDQPKAIFPAPGFVRVQWPAGQAKVSIIIPTKDKLEYLERCLSSLMQMTAYRNYEIILVDTGSREPQTQRYYETLRRDPRIQIISYSGTFNYSAANNLGARSAGGDLLLFLNNDVEILEPDWLDELAHWAERPEIGAVGAKLLYPDGTIQHAGVVIGMEGHASHVFWGAHERQSSIFGSVDWYRNYMAVTGACLMVRRDVFDKIGGFDEEYQIAFSDIEFCLAIVKAGYRIVYSPFARLRHYEGRSRANHIPENDIRQGYAKMRPLVEAGDPYYNPNLSYNYRMPALALRGDESRSERLRRVSGIGQRRTRGQDAASP